jgi:histidinol-phosphate/aromatic aminotransferase/cobyric acid decarboxylase-like protein
LPNAPPIRRDFRVGRRQCAPVLVTRPGGAGDEGYTMRMAFHGGAFWDALGSSFDGLDQAPDIIGADVLDAWFDPSPRVLEKVREHLALALRTSPPTTCDGLVAAIAETRGFDRRQVAVGGGSSDLIFALLPRMVGATDRVLILDPMYGEYAHVIEHLIGSEPCRHALRAEDGFALDIDRLADDIRRLAPRLVIVVNPNSPTGRAVPGASIAFLAEAFPDTTFLIDETYIEYVGAAHSVERATAHLRNLAVVKSMSKVYALSGARIGYLVAHPETLEPLARHLPPWAVSLVGQIAGIEALRDPVYYRARYDETHRLRERMTAALDGVPVTVYPSACNFFLMRLHRHSASRVIDRLRTEGIYLRNGDSMSPRFADDHIRVAVKAEPANDRIVSALRAALGE